MHKAAQAYFQTQVTTTSQGELLLLLYDGAIKFLNQAKERMAARDMAGKGLLISKALDIINELDGSLNPEKGGDLAGNLHKLYFYCNARLLTANLKLNPVLIDEVIKILTGLRGAYAQIINTPEALAATADLAARQPANAAMPSRPAQPMQNGAIAPAGAAGRFQANAAYGQQAQQGRPAPQTDFASPIMPPAGFMAAPATTPVQGAQPSGTTMAPNKPQSVNHAATGAPVHSPLAQPPHGTNATATVQSSPSVPETAAPATAAGAPSAAAPSPPGPLPGAPAGAPLTGGGFGANRLAASNLYKRFAQN